jgi:HAE1 family hydrophobic/amphiphilic exporter-1
MNLTLAAIKRPIWVWMCVVAALVLGWRALGSLAVEENPEVSFPNISVQTAYFGANPEEIENQITRVIEEAVSSVNGIQTIESTSIEGVSIVSIQFELRINQDTALSDVKSKVDGVVGRLPDDVERPIVSKLDFSGMPILYVAAESDQLTPLELRDFLDDRVADRLARIPGVAQVSIQGGQEREIRVAVDRDRLLSYGIGILDVTSAINAATVNVPGGRITEGNRETSLRVQGEFKSVEELRNLVIPIGNRDDPNGAPAIVRLQDIADVTDGPAERTEISRVNGREAVLVGIQKSREGNTVEITEMAKAELRSVGLLQGTREAAAAGSPAEGGGEHGITFTVTQESAVQVEESITDLNVALILGVVLVIAIIYLFLHNFRGTLIVGLAIPTCLFVAFALIQAFGFSLNSMTMLGLSLAIGILVDDAIVVLENTYRHLVKGEDPQQAALNGRMEIGLAALAITMVDLVVFLPVAFMGGIIGQFFRPFALTVAAATFTSLLVSFTLTPMLASRWYRKGENLEDKHGFAKWFDERFQAFAEGYRQLLDKALRRRWLVFMAGWAFLFGVFMMVAAGGGMPDMQTAIGPAIGMAMMAIVFALGLTIGSSVARTRPVRWAAFSLAFLGFFALGAMVPATAQMAPMIGMFALGIGLGGFFKKPMITPLLSGVGFAAVLVFFGAAGFMLSQNKGGPILANRFFGGGDMGQVQVQITMPPGSSLERTTQVVERIEKIAMEIPETEYVTSQIGQLSGGFGVGNSGSQYAGLSVDLIPKAAFLDSLMFWTDHGNVRTRSSTTITSELQQLIGKVPDAKIVVTTGGAFGGAPIDVRVMSTNPDLVPAAAQKTMEVMSGIEGLVNLELSSKPGKPEMLIRPNRVRLADNDLTVQQLGGVTRTLFEGDTSAKYREAGLEYDIRVNLTDDIRQNTDMLSTVPITFRQGNPIYLGDIAAIDTSVGPDKVERRDRQRQIAVTSQLLPGHVPGTMGAIITQKLDEAKASGQIPEEVTFQQGGENEVQAREFPYLGAAFGLGLVLVFLVLASLFDNILYPFIIQLAQPQAFVGALLALMMTSQPLDLVGMIGFIMLIGLVGKNAILLVDYTNTLREKGRDRHEALLEAGPIRLRPIMMTTLAMILAMLPVAAAIGRGSEFRAPLGIVIIGGLTLSTLLTLFVIPASYTLFDDLSNEISGILQRRRDRMDAKKRRSPTSIAGGE